MSDDETSESTPNSSPRRPRYGVAQPVAGQKRNRSRNALELGPRKRPAKVDPLVHHGRHFGRAVFAFANIHALISVGLNLDEEEVPETQQYVEAVFTSFNFRFIGFPRARREARVFYALLKMVPGLEDRLYSDATDENDVLEIATLLQKGASSARSDDTKSLKSVVIDWIAPDGEPLRPPIARNAKLDRGFNHDRTGFLLCPAGMDWNDPEIRSQLKNKELLVPGNHWPIFLFRDEKYDEDEPWRGFCRSKLLVSGFKHIFTSPSSVDDDPKATRSGNARLHGMTSVTRASIAYVATQIRFALSSAGVFCRTDKETDSETFYTSLLELFEDPEEQDEVKELLTWWNKQIFPSFSTFRRVIPANSVLSKMKAKRAALKALDPNQQKTTTGPAKGVESARHPQK